MRVDHWDPIASVLRAHGGQGGQGSFLSSFVHGRFPKDQDPNIAPKCYNPRHKDPQKRYPETPRYMLGGPGHERFRRPPECIWHGDCF